MTTPGRGPVAGHGDYSGHSWPYGNQYFSHALYVPFATHWLIT